MKENRSLVRDSNVRKGQAELQSSSSMMLCDLSARQIAAESDADSPFSRDSSVMEQRDVDAIDRRKRQRYTSTDDEEATAKTVTLNHELHEKMPSTEPQLSMKSHGNSPSIFSFPTDDTDSPFSKGSFCSSSGPKVLALVTNAKRSGNMTNAKKKGTKSLKLMAKPQIHKASGAKDQSHHATSTKYKQSLGTSDNEKFRASNIERNNNRPRDLGLIKVTSQKLKGEKKTAVKDAAKRSEPTRIDKVKGNVKSVYTGQHKASSTATSQPKPLEAQDGFIDYELKILSDEEAWARLSSEKYGFTFQNNEFFCLPGIDSSHSRFKQGHDYFKDLISLRRNLCAYGIPDPNQYILQDEELSNWIRLSISTVAQRLSVIPSFTPLKKFNQAFSVGLSKIGFKYGSGGYSFPNKERVFESALDLLCHLSRFGLPPSASLDKINENTLFSLEMFLSDYTLDKRQIW